MNIVASISAIVAIVLYAVHLGRVNMSWRCDTVTTNYNCYYLAARAQVNLLLQGGAEFIWYFSECGPKCTFKGKWKRLLPQFRSLEIKLSLQFHVRVGPFSRLTMQLSSEGRYSQCHNGRVKDSKSGL